MTLDNCYITHTFLKKYLSNFSLSSTPTLKSKPNSWSYPKPTIWEKLFQESVSKCILKWAKVCKPLKKKNSSNQTMNFGPHANKNTISCCSKRRKNTKNLWTHSNSPWTSISRNQKMTSMPISTYECQTHRRWAFCYGGKSFNSWADVTITWKKRFWNWNWDWTKL